MTHKLVPIEPTPEMLEAASNVEMLEACEGDPTTWYPNDRAIWEAMLSASPAPPISQNYREEVARGLYAHDNRKRSWEDAFEIDRNIARGRADAAISTLQRLGWKEP